MSQCDDHKEAFSRIIGGRLTSIQFVMDYLIVGFDEKGALTSLVWPVAEVEGLSLSFGDIGYRDALCSLIGDSVEMVLVDERELITISMASGKRLRIPLADGLNLAERALLTGPNNYLYVA